MVAERLAKALEEWRRYGPPRAKPREVDVDSLLGIPHIVDVIVVRRSGKTYLMFYMAQKLMSRGERVLCVNLVDKMLLPEDELTLLRRFDEYMEYGGFPEVVLSEGKDVILRSYYEDILYRDLVDRFKVRETLVMENFLKYLLTNVGRPFSIRRARDYLSSFGIRTSTRTIMRYLSMLEEIFLFFFLTIRAGGVRDVMRYPRKAYAVDVGLSRVVSHEEDRGFRLENLVFLELKRRELRDPGTEIHYWRSKRGEEVDFVLVRGHACEEAVQVTWEITGENLRRELNPLIKCRRDLGCKRAVVVTYDQEEALRVEGMEVRAVPAYKWMLKPERVQGNRRSS